MPRRASARRSPRFDITVTAIASLRNRAARVEIERERGHDLVAVDELAALVDRDHAVGVAVEREAEVGAVLAHCGLQRLGIRRTAVRR